MIIDPGPDQHQPAQQTPQQVHLPDPATLSPTLHQCPEQQPPLPDGPRSRMNPEADAVPRMTGLRRNAKV